MLKRSMLQVAVPFVVGVAVGAVPAALAQKHEPHGGGPTEGKPTIVKTNTVELGPEIEGMQGRQLRMRVVRLDPGAKVPVHDHKDRPEVGYVLQGALTESLDGKAVQLRAGDTWSAEKGTKHAHQNDGKEPVMVVAVDVFKSQ